MKTVVLSGKALKQFLALPMDVQEVIDGALDAYARTGRADVKRLKSSAYLRMRVGRYRVIFAEDAVTVVAVEIGKRDTQTYKGGKLR